ncbi:hypothetical protein IFR05_017538, partial [Cadophora sp. M221]
MTPASSKVTLPSSSRHLVPLERRSSPSKRATFRAFYIMFTLSNRSATALGLILEKQQRQYRHYLGLPCPGFTQPDINYCFDPFTRLPSELRRMIYKLSITPRILLMKYEKGLWTTQTNIPSILQINQESRAIGLELYKGVFLEEFVSSANPYICT